MKNSIFLKALEGCNQSKGFPVWMMRQAGRYLPEYQSIKKKYSLKTLFTTPEIAKEITLMPFKHLALDAAIVFWDIMLIAEPLGFEIDYIEKIGPVAKKNPAFKNSSFDYLYQTMKEAKKDLKVPLIGFCGAPFTVFSYLFKDVKKRLYCEPEKVKVLLNQITQMSIENLKGQVHSGADAVQIFESSAHMLSEEQLKEFSLPYIGKILKTLNVPKIVFGIGTCQYMSGFASLDTNAVSFDWKEPIYEIRKKATHLKSIQGNFDPHLLYASQTVIQKQVEKVMGKMRKDSGWIINLGHGVKPDIPLDNIKYFIDTVKNYDRNYC